MSSKKLLVLDLDGILFQKEYDPESTIPLQPGSFRSGKFYITPHPDLESFLDELFKKNIFVGIWSSSQKATIKGILSQLFPAKYYPKRFLFIWSRDRCQMDPDAGKDPEIKEFATVKKVSSIIKNPVVNYLKAWNTENILMVDDSPLKLRFNPSSTMHIRKDFEESLLTIFEDPFFLPSS
jgi:hypothetical protein